MTDPGNDHQITLEELHNEKPVTDSPTIRLVVGSMFLYKSFYYCTRPGKNGPKAWLQPEWVHYATGPIIVTPQGSLRVVERIVPFEIIVQSPVFVEGEITASTRALIGMEDYGYALHLVCHSHPGSSPSSNFPSGIDLNHQLRLERGGYQAVGCIFSRDGYARFFSAALPFEISIYGTGVKQHGPHLFHLTQIDPADSPGVGSAESVGSSGG